jgi:galactokinase
MTDSRLTVSSPGRLCLLGEHQDYFGLAIIAAAIDLRITVSGKANPARLIRLDLPDIGGREEWPLDRELAYTEKRDYLKSAVNLLQREGTVFPSGWDGRVEGKIPINSGTASSSALVVAWTRFLLEAAGDPRAGSPAEVAELAFRAEVAEFREPGGKMDHYASALGGIVHIRFGDDFRVQSLPDRLGEFVLADSTVRKNTTGTLGFIKTNVLEGMKKVRERLPGFDLKAPLDEAARAEIDKLPKVERRLLRGTLTTRDLTEEGLELFRREEFDHSRFGVLLDRQQEVLRDDLGISVPRIDEMVDAARRNGALGAKINGSGEGGCILAYAPGKAEAVAEALRAMGSPAFVVRVDQGVRAEA